MSKLTSIRLKGLENQKIKLEGKLSTLKSEQSMISKEVQNTSRKLNEIKSEIKNIKKNSKEIIISDHVIVRYIERVVGIDIEKLKKEICPDDITEKIKTFGSGSYSVNDNQFIIKTQDNVIVTLIKN